MSGAAPAALADGSLIFLAVILVVLLGVIWGYYTKSGSDIALRPSDGLGHGGDSQAPGAAGPDSITGKVDGEQDPFETHGTG